MENTKRQPEQTLHMEAADSDSRVCTGRCPSDWKESKASKVSCQPQRATVTTPELEQGLSQPAAATAPFTQGQQSLCSLIGSNSTPPLLFSL